jgi:RNA polymerase sigma factor (sigma-70 family)
VYSAPTPVQSRSSESAERIPRIRYHGGYIAMDIERTTTTLLEGLFDSDNEAAWAMFDARYRPIVVAFARKLGMTESDAGDVAQETILQFLKEYKAGKYDRQRGRLRSWLIGIARFRVAGVYRKKASKREYRGESAMVIIPEEDAALETLWDTERRTIILQAAFKEMQATTKADDRNTKAFEMLVFNQIPIETVCAELDMTAQQAYLAKSRSAKRLKAIIDRLELVYDEGAP